MAVTSIPFRKLDLEMPPPEEGFWAGLSSAIPFIKYVLSLAALMIVLFFVLRPLVKAVLATGTEERVGLRKLPAASAPGTQLESKSNWLEEETVTPEESEGLRVIEGIRNLAGQDARQFADLLKVWLRQP